jgi:NADH dehydrogenase
MDEMVTLFGGGGFLGRYVAQELMRVGARVRIAQRDPREAYFLKPQGGLGQTQYVPVDIRRGDSVRRAAAGSTAVINLVGILKGDFEAFHVNGARHAAQAAVAAGARAFVQVSAIGADPASPSAYAASKGRGEAAASEAFPGATVVRPSILFGPEDRFMNRFAQMMQLAPALPVIRGATRFQPAWVADVARAIAAAALEPGIHAGRCYELGGPQVMTMGEINAWVARTIGRKVRLFDLPDGIAGALAGLPGGPMTRDQWKLLQSDNVVAPGAQGFEAFGIQPRPLSAVAPSWLVRYRKHGRFSLSSAA